MATQRRPLFYAGEIDGLYAYSDGKYAEFSDHPVREIEESRHLLRVKPRRERDWRLFLRMDLSAYAQVERFGSHGDACCAAHAGHHIVYFDPVRAAYLSLRYLDSTVWVKDYTQAMVFCVAGAVRGVAMPTMPDTRWAQASSPSRTPT